MTNIKFEVKLFHIGNKAREMFMALQEESMSWIAESTY